MGVEKKFMFKGLIAVMIFLVLGACGTSKKAGPGIQLPGSDSLVQELLRKDLAFFDNYLKNKDSFHIQIIYTQIDRDASNQPQFRYHVFNLDHKAYFYPASTVKMPIALLALEKLAEHKNAGIDRGTAMLTEADFSGQTAVLNDPQTATGVPAIEGYIKKIFLVSDNDAYNRLYEWLGQEEINRRLQEKGYADVQIRHRLDVALSDVENRHTNPIRFLDSSAKLLYAQPGKLSQQHFASRSDRAGRGYYRNGALVEQPFDLSAKNRIGLASLDRMLKTILFPSAFDAKTVFHIPEADRRFVLQYMSQFPRETNFPDYAPGAYPDAYVKFLLYGADSSIKIPGQRIRIFNKPGDAYGFLTDIAYIVDFEKKIEFTLSATIYCNSDGILNDDHYDYQTIGLPFLRRLGELIYEHELGRNRKHQPDLSAFRMQYDK